MPRRGRTARRGAGARAHVDPAVQRGALLAATATHWYDARTGLSVSNWTPRNSGAAYAATQATASLQPTITTIGAGTHPAAQFDGADDVLDLLSSKWALGNDVTFSAVAFVALGSAVSTHAVFNAAVAANYVPTFVALGHAGTSFYFAHGATGNVPGSVLGSSGICEGISFVGGTRTSQAYLNGSALGVSVVHAASAAGVLDQARIGGLAYSGSVSFSGKVAHIAIFEGAALSTQQHSDLNAYFASICA